MFICLISVINHQTMLFIVFISVFGFATFPIIPVVMELTTRKFDKIPIYFTNTVLFVSSQIFTIFLQFFSGMAFDHMKQAGIFVIIMISYLYLFIFWFLKDIDNNVK